MIEYKLSVIDCGDWEMRLARRAFLSSGGTVMATALSGVRSMRADVPKSAIQKLREGLKGRLITPMDHDYELARRVVSFNTETNKHPVLIVRCKSADDARRAVEFAR